MLLVCHTNLVYYIRQLVNQLPSILCLSSSLFIGFVAVVRNEVSTENYVFDNIEDITGVNYTGDFVVSKVEDSLQKMKSKYFGTIRAVTCDSDGAHRKARKDLMVKHPELVILPCSAHQVNLVFHDVFKFLPKFKATCSCAVSIISWFSKSSLSLGKLQELQKGLYGKRIALPKPTETRWYSYYFSFLQLQKSSLALQVKII